MPPLTLAVLASVLRMHGADAAITSDNKGIDDLLADIRGQFAEQIDPSAPLVILAAINEGGAGARPHQKTLYTKTYTKNYGKWVPRGNQTPGPSMPGGSRNTPGGRIGR